MRKIPFLLALTSSARSRAQAFAPSESRSSLHTPTLRSLQLSAFSGGGGGGNFNNNNDGFNSNRNRVSDFGKTQQQQQFGSSSSGQFGGGYDNNFSSDGNSNFGGGYGVDDDGGYGYNSQQFRSDQFLQHISDFCIGCNEFWRSLCIPPLQDFLETKPGGTALSNPLSKVLAGPEYPGISRPLWLVMSASFATWFNWFGYYIFSVNEELVSSVVRTTCHSFHAHGVILLEDFPHILSAIVFPHDFPSSAVSIRTPNDRTSHYLRRVWHLRRLCVRCVHRCAIAVGERSRWRVHPGVGSSLARPIADELIPPCQ